MSASPQFRVLIVDDDPMSRRILRQCMRNLPCSVTEAENGLDALEKISADPPDLVLLDVDMPVLDGLQTLQEIRKSPRFGRLPVVSVSGRPERHLVMQLIQLGLTSFIVKPLQPRDGPRRIRAILEQLSQASTAAPLGTVSPPERKPYVLLIDPDSSFRQFARAFLESAYQVLEADTGALGVGMVREHLPEKVIVSENVALPGWDRLMGMIQEIPGSMGRKVYLLQDGSSPPLLGFPLAGCLRRRFVPDLFRQELRNAQILRKDASCAIFPLLCGEMHPEIVGAVQHSIGIMALEEASLLQPEMLAGIPRDVDVHTELTPTEGGTSVVVRLFAGDEAARTLAGRMDAAHDDGEIGVQTALTELLNAVAGRARESLAARGFHFEQSASGPAPTGWNGDEALALPFSMANGTRIGVVIHTTGQSLGEERP